MRFRNLSFSIVLVFLLSVSCIKSFADEAQAVTQTPMLKGQVVQIDVTLNDLRDARLAVSRARKATANLYDEVTRQQMTMEFNPNMVGTTLIMAPRPSFTGQFLPARPKWVKESMEDIGPIIELFNEDVNAAIESNRRTDVSENARKSLDPIRDEVFAGVKTSHDLYTQLQKMTSGGVNYDNNGIATAAKSLDNEMKKLDKSLKRGISILQKEAKTLKRA